MANKKRARSDAELIETEAWGVPSWTSKDCYPKNTDLKTNDEWKWEFLRRTKEYRQDWQRTKCPPTPLTKAASKFHVVPPFDDKALAKKYGMSHPVPPQRSYGSLPDDFSFMRLPEILDGGVIIHPRIPVPDIKAPDEAKAVVKSQQDKNAKAEISEADLARYAKQMQPSKPTDWYDMRVWVEYDLGYSLDNQLLRAEDTLYDVQKKLKIFMRSFEKIGENDDPYGYGPQEVGMRKVRTPDKKYEERIILLRILDAKNCGRRNGKIAHALLELTGKSMNPSTVSKNYKIALQLWKCL